MKFKSQVITQASGSIGGTTYSRNRGGMYMRARAIPTNPNTIYQQTVRNNLSVLAARWATTLTQAQRNEWGNYAALSPVTDKLGDSMLLSGFNMFVRCNACRMAGGIAIVDDGPVTPGLTELSAVGHTASDSPPDFGVSYDNADQWAVETGGFLMIFSSRFLSPTINFFKGPFRFLGTVAGDTTTPPTSPADLGDFNGFGQELGNSEFIGMRSYVRAIATDASGRLSPMQIVSATVTA